MFQNPDVTSLRPEAKKSLLARDPRFLIAGFVLIIVSAFVIEATAGLFVVFLYVLVLCRLGSLPARPLLKAARAAAVFVVLVVAVNAVLVKGQPAVASVPFVTREGIASGIHASVRVFVLIFSAVLFVSVLSAEDVARSVSALVAPVSEKLARRVALYGFIVAGFLPLYSDEIRRIETAQRFRGGGLEGGPIAKLNGVRLLVVPLILSAVHRSAQLAVVVEVREIGSRIDGVLTLDKPARRDYIFLVATAAVITAALVIF